LKQRFAPTLQNFKDKLDKEKITQKKIFDETEHLHKTKVWEFRNSKQNNK
jgi:hypothetical protein